MARRKRSGFTPPAWRRAVLAACGALGALGLAGVLLAGCASPRVQTHVYQATQTPLRQYSSLEIMNFTAGPAIAVPSAMLTELTVELAKHARLGELFASVTRGPAPALASLTAERPEGAREQAVEEADKAAEEEEKEGEEKAALPVPAPTPALGRTLRVEGQVVHYRLSRLGPYDRLGNKLEDLFYRTYSGDDTVLIVRLQIRDRESGLELYGADVNATLRDTRASPVGSVVEEIARFIESRF